MVVERTPAIAFEGDEQGQSVIEFLLMLPAVIGITVFLIRTNSAIQMSIVDQQYARAQTTWLTFNSPVFPELRLQLGAFVVPGYNQMVLGVSDNVAPNPDEDEYSPKSSEQNIAPNRKVAAQE